VNRLIGCTLFCLCCLILSLAPLGGPLAAVVVNSADSGAGSLRDALINAVAGELITFNLPDNTVIVLQSPISTSKSVVISGLDVVGLTLSGGGTRPILITSAPLTSTPLTLRGLRLTQGFATKGGAISNSGALLLDRVAVVSNSASDGGGGIFNSGSLLLLHSEVSENAITSTTGIGGGGILSDQVPSSPAPVLTLLNSTVARNSASPTGASGMAGGGISFANGSLTLLHSTVAANSAPAGGANIHQGSLSATSLRLRGSIVSDAVANSVTANESNVYQPGGAIISAMAVGGYNLVSPRSTATGWLATDLPSATNVGLGAVALADNGGLVRSLSITAASPAYEKIPLTSCLDQNDQPLTRDVRAVVRGPSSALCEIGAFEVQTTPPCNLDINADGQNTSDKDGVLLSRLLFGVRGINLIAAIPTFAPRSLSSEIASFVGGAAAYDVFGRARLSPQPLRDDLVLSRLMRLARCVVAQRDPGSCRRRVSFRSQGS
jgi:hypothetical protein